MLQRLLFLSVFLFSFIMSLAWFVYIQPFFRVSQLNLRTVVAGVQTGLNQNVRQWNGRVNFLILGTDDIEGRNGSGILTDTMIVLSLNVHTGKGVLIPVPRDLWLADEKTKINAMYYYGKTTNPAHPEQRSAEAVSVVLGVPIQYTVVTQLQTISEVIDALGGVDIHVQKTFTDAIFPREGVDVTKEKDPNVLYETVTFTEGDHRMLGKEALQYMRSRHSTDLEEGTDDARSRRQEQVMYAVIGAVKREVQHKNALALGKLFAIYEKNFSQELPLPDLVALAKTMKTNLVHIELKQHTIMPLLVHPAVAKYKQWVYEARDPSFRELQLAVQGFLDVKE